MTWSRSQEGHSHPMGVTCEEGCQRALGSVLREYRVLSRARKTEFTQRSVLCEHRVQSRARKTECTLTGPGLQKRKSFLLARPAFPPCKRVWAEPSHWSKSRRKILSLFATFFKKKIIAHFNLDLILFCFTTSLLFIHLFLALFC